MKLGKRLTALVLTLALVCGLTVGASAAEESKEIKAQLNYDITVTYNGEVQVLKDAAGNTVYPISYEGTTYLPVRAVSNMLGVAVDWDGATQTVILSDPADGKVAAPTSTDSAATDASGQEEITASLSYGITATYNGKKKTMKDAAGNTVYPISYEGTTYLPVRAVSNMLGIKVDWDGVTQTVLLWKTATSEPSGGKDVFNGKKTSEDAKIFGVKHIGYDWAEIDWSTAGDSYIRVKFNKQSGFSTSAECYVRWNDNGTPVYYGEGGRTTAFGLAENEWTNIPLTGGSTEYIVYVNLCFHACEHYMSDEEKTAYDTWNGQLIARFNAEITNPDGRWLMSENKVDWEHAPQTCEKALEITKDCKTDAEKITAVFKWVSQNIKYDKTLSDSVIKEQVARNTAKKEPAKTPDDYDSYEEYLIATGGCGYDPVNGAHTIPPAAPTSEELEKLGYTDQDHLDLDYILTHKTGICAHYAALMTGMLRSVGVPCKYVSGRMYTGKIIKGYDDKYPGWISHAWVAVRPETGTLNKSALGAGEDYSAFDIRKSSEPTGWIRLDPTNAHDKTFTSNDKNYDVVSNY